MVLPVQKGALFASQVAEGLEPLPVLFTSQPVGLPIEEDHGVNVSVEGVRGRLAIDEEGRLTFRFFLLLMIVKLI